ncbi:hypothetical protein, partial [Pseudomonas syringae group genomosp. 7]|uniref:hypothetical protein n=1 Tax=Pseudomonas syringae group genomosp. 7 TaxID=251699 RepID=UPI00377020A9
QQGVNEREVAGEELLHWLSSEGSSHWRFSEDGQLSERKTGRNVTRVDWNGIAIVECVARAVLLGWISENIFMLNGHACRM